MTAQYCTQAVNPIQERNYPMNLSVLQPPTNAEDYITTILPLDALARIAEFRKAMKAVKKVSKIPSMPNLLLPHS